MQVTFWEYPQPNASNASAAFNPSNLQDYACKQWSGLLSTYHKPRWQLFLNQTLAQLHADPHAIFDIGRFHSTMYRWFNAWQEADDAQDFPERPSGDPIALSRSLHNKYAPKIQAAPSATRGVPRR